MLSHWAQPTMPIALVIESGNAYLTITFRHKSTKTKEKLSSFSIASGNGLLPEGAKPLLYLNNDD